MHLVNCGVLGLDQGQIAHEIHLFFDDGNCLFEDVSI